jgi:hypothetical protein
VVVLLAGLMDVLVRMGHVAVAVLVLVRVRVVMLVL